MCEVPLNLMEIDRKTVRQIERARRWTRARVSQRENWSNTEILRTYGQQLMDKDYTDTPIDRRTETVRASVMFKQHQTQRPSETKTGQHCRRQRRSATAQERRSKQLDGQRRYRRFSRNIHVRMWRKTFVSWLDFLRCSVSIMDPSGVMRKALGHFPNIRSWPGDA